MRQWEVWKAKPPGFQRDHWFVLISSPERIASPRHHQVNGLACFTQAERGLQAAARPNRGTWMKSFPASGQRALKLMSIFF